MQLNAFIWNWFSFEILLAEARAAVKQAHFVTHGVAENWEGVISSEASESWEQG